MIDTMANQRERKSMKKLFFIAVLATVCCGCHSYRPRIIFPTMPKLDVRHIPYFYGDNKPIENIPVPDKREFEGIITWL